MGVLSGLEPERVFYYFEEISKIPHGSYHEKQISDYLVNFANEHHFQYYQDSLYNVVMLVDASKGYEQEEPIILQGHMDMVCEKNPTAKIDMEKEGLDLQIDGEFIYAKDTTLGGDDGIAIAYMLAIAEDSTICHPPLEFIMTVSEEVGMEGANGIDLSMLKGHRMINLDSEEEGIFLSSCAGGLSLHSSLPVKRKISSQLDWYELSVEGLLGGHSGCEIHKERGNANKILGRVLYELRKVVNYEIYSMGGGKKDNVIPFQSKACIGIKQEDLKNLNENLSIIDSILKAEYALSDTNIELIIKKTEDSISKMILEEESVSKILTLLMILPNGVQGMSMSMEGLVETSLNLGIMKLTDDNLFLQHAVRSSVTTKKYYIANQIESILKSFGGMVTRKGDYPAWEYREDSVVRTRVIELYKKIYGKEPIVEGIHAGLECGLLAGKIENLDCVAMGPDILDIHTASERLHIESTRRVYEFLLEYLKIKDGE